MIRFLLPLLLFGIQALALPKVTVEKINGFEVHFVDIGRGNTFGVSFQVPYGTLHDYGRFMGRAHLLEHLMHVGTLKYPGYHAFDELLLPAGVDSNASTWYHRTYYYASANQNQAELIVKVFLSMLGGLELSPEAVEKERQVVINEIVEEGMPTQGDAFRQMPFTQLLPPGHPWAMSMLGNRPSLEGLTKKDLQDLYDQVYRPELVKIAIHGNFSEAGSLDRVRSLVRQNVRASGRQNGAKIPERTEDERGRPEFNLAQRSIPSIFSDSSLSPESEKRIYIHTPDFRYGLLTLEGDAGALPANSRAMEFLVRHLGSELPGSVIHKLKTELGLITECSVNSARIRNRQLLFVKYTVSGLGVGHEREINETVFRALKAMQDSGVSANFLEREKRQIRHDLEISAKSVASFLDTYVDFQLENSSFERQIQDLDQVSSADVQSAARLFRPDQTLYAYSGPMRTEMEFDPVYQRAFKLEDNRADLAKYLEIMRQPSTLTFDPNATRVDLGPLTEFKASSFKASLPRIKDERFAAELMEGHAALAFEFQLNPEDPSDLIALDIVMDAFKERYLAEYEDMSSRYELSLRDERRGRRWILSAAGENSYAAKALNHILAKLASFSPTAEEFARARERYFLAKDSQYVDDFSVFAAMVRTKAILAPLEAEGMDARRAAENLDAEKVRAAWEHLRRRANRHWAASGAIAEQDLQQLRLTAQALFPAPLSSEDEVRLTQSFDWQEEVRTLNEKFAKSKGEDAYAMVRAYQGPAVGNLREVAAFQVLGSLISNQIYIHNRGKNKLGYVHNAAARPLDGQHYFMLLYGGTKGDRNALKTIAGWRHVLKLITDGKRNDAIADAISSVISSLEQEKSSPSARVEQLLSGLYTHGNPRIQRELLAQVKTLSADDVREAARRYLTGDGTPYTQLTLHGCEDLLSP